MNIQHNQNYISPANKSMSNPPSILTNNLNPKNIFEFKGRAKIINEADAVCRKINRDFPHTSNSFLWGNLRKPKEYDDVFERIGEPLYNLVKAQEDTESAYDYYKLLIDFLKTKKIANCGELADITYLICQNKGFKNPKIVGLYGFDSKTQSYHDYDHTAVSFEYENKMVIIDPWIGVADFAKNIKLTYKNLYSTFLENYDKRFNLIFAEDPVVKIHPDDLKDLTDKYKELNAAS